MDLGSRLTYHLRMAWTASRRTVALIAAIGVLLPSLAILQYQWLGELSGLEQMRARQNLEAATVRLSTEFDARLAQLYSSIATIDLNRPEGPESAVRGALRDLTPTGFVKELRLVERKDIGTTAPAWFASATSRTLVDEVPAIVAPVGATRDRWIVAMLDMDHIANDLIPVMLAGCFEGGIPSALDVMIIRDDLPDMVVYRSRPDLARADFDATVPGIPLFAIHGRDLDAATAERLMPDAAAHRWRVLLQHQSGSLEATLGAIRFRNLAIGIGVLVLLALSVGLLVASMHSMQRAAREQLELVARMSHELRTPLATITCAGENLADDVVGTPAEARHYGELIKVEGRRLAKTIGDILLCCRLQARPDTVLNRRPTDVADVIASAVEESRAAAPAGQRIDTVIEPGLPIVLADRDALKMAVKNLVLNAVKYGHGGPVRVSASGGSDVAIAVEDDGPGIPEEERRRIFEPFFRGRHAQEHEIEGSGIGLNIVKQVVKSHGGRVRVANGERRGARFILQLPAMKAAQRVAAEPVRYERWLPARAATAPERRILLVDDEPGLRRTLSDRLRKEGYAVETAVNGAIALDLARKDHYDLIILDLNLPAKDGLQVCHELRREGQNVAVLMLTARDSIADKITGLKSGADDYMTKPFESAELLARIEALLRRTRGDAGADELAFGDIVVRPRAGQVLRGGRAVRLSAQEFKLLVHLVRHPGVVLSRDELLDAVWGYQATPETRTVDVHVSWLRQKLEPDPHNPRYIVTVYGLGYRFEH